MPVESHFALLQPTEHTRDTAGGNGEEAPPKFEAIDVPAGVSYLEVKGGRARLWKKAPGAKSAVAVEPLELARRSALILVSPKDQRVRVNGQIAPRVTVIAEKDQVQLAGAETVLHATRYTRSSVGPPPAECIGKKCPICRVKFTADTTVYVCSNCGQALHAEGPEKGEDRLECASLTSNCPTCQEPVTVNVSEGYTYVPQELE